MQHFPQIRKTKTLCVPLGQTTSFINTPLGYYGNAAGTGSTNSVSPGHTPASNASASRSPRAPPLKQPAKSLHAQTHKLRRQVKGTRARDNGRSSRDNDSPLPF